jgi:hypothetical protein
MGNFCHRGCALFIKMPHRANLGFNSGIAISEL